MFSSELLDSGSSLGDVNIDRFVILFLYPGSSILAADCDIFLQHKSQNKQCFMEYELSYELRKWS